MRVKIETYRGIDIEFETSSETFFCTIDEVDYKEKKTYAQIKKSIDEYKSTNKEFKPFQVINNPSSMFGGVDKGVCTIVGLRKDERFIYEGKDGKKQQISKHSEKNVIIYEKEMELKLVEIAYLETLVDDAQKKVQEAKKKVKGISLNEYKKTLEL